MEQFQLCWSRLATACVDKEIFNDIVANFSQLANLCSIDLARPLPCMMIGQQSRTTLSQTMKTILTCLHAFSRAVSRPRIFVLYSDWLISLSTQDRFFTLVLTKFSIKSLFNHILGTTRAEVECIEESGTPVDDKYCKATPRPDDKQKTCNENQCPPT